MKYGIYYAYWERQWGGDYCSHVERVAKLGFDVLEISCAGLADMKEDEIKRLQEACNRTGIVLTGGYGPKATQSLSSSDESVVENGFRFWKDTFSVLQQLNIHLVGGGLYGYWPVDYTKPVEKEKELENSIKNMRKLADMAADYGIETLGMETLNRHEGFLINSAKECRAYVDAVDKPNVKVMLDTYHMLLEEDSLREAILTAGEKLGHFHVGENNRKLPGQGHITDWDEIAGALREIGYSGDVVMEPFVIPGGEVGKDIRLFRNLLDDTSEERLDRDAAESLSFLKNKFQA